MSKVLIILTLSATLLCAQANTWTKVTGPETGTRYNCALSYFPDSNRHLLTMGGWAWNSTGEPFDVQMFTPTEGRWVNYLPHDSLYGSAALDDSVEALAGKWADSTGNAYGNGRTHQNMGYNFVFRTIDGYLRPNIYMSSTLTYNHYTYDSDSGKIYYYMLHRLFTYHPASRTWDTIPLPVDPSAFEGGTTHLRWGSLCYDPVNREILLFGGGNIDADRGHLGTWIMRTADKTWTKLNLSVEPPPRCESPMVYDPVNECIVLFGGDHFDYLMADTWVYHCATRTWEEKTPALSPAPRVGHAMLYLPKSGTVALLGGFDYTPEPTSYCESAYMQRTMLELWSYDVATNTWKAIAGWTQSAAGIPTPYTRQPCMATVDTGDNILLLGRDGASGLEAFMCPVDPTAQDASVESQYGVTAGTTTLRTDGWTPAWFTQGVPQPDTAANEAALRNLPANQWTQITPPKVHTYNDFCWGTSRYDPENDVILSWNGGHSSYSGNQVLQYSPHTNRMTVGFHAEVPLDGELANSGGWPTYHSFTNRPFMTVHTYASYNVCEALSRMMVVKGYHNYLYDPVTQDWDSVMLDNANNLGFHMRINVIKMGRTLAHWARDYISVFDTTSQAWQRLTLSGPSVPDYYGDSDGAAYDPVRDRIIMIDKTTPAVTYICDMQALTLSKIAPAQDTILNALLAGSKNNLREAMYLPGFDVIMSQTISSNDKHLVFDCATDTWGEIENMEPIPSGLISHTNGLMWDRNRGLIWLYNPISAKNTVYVMRPDTLRFTADVEKRVTGANKVDLSAWPNPCNAATRLRITLPGHSPVKLCVYDMNGRLIRRIVSGRLGPGAHDFAWKALDARENRVSAGIYMVRLTAGKRVLMRRAVVLR